MIEVWGRRNSSNVMPVMWAIGELGLDYKRHDIGDLFGGNDTPDYLAMNPNGVVPTIRDGDMALWESNAIVRYLAARYGAGGIWPEAPAARAVADQWMEWSKTTLSPPVTGLFWSTVRIGREDWDPAAIARLEDQAAKVMEILNARLADHPFVGGDDLTIADFPLGGQLWRYSNFEVRRPETPNIDAWMARLMARPAYMQHVAFPFGKDLQEWNALERAGAGA